MSEHGSFITEHIVCPDCLSGLREVLCSGNFLLVPGTLLDTAPIIAGPVKSTFAGGELEVFESELMEAIQKRICHKVRIAILAEQGDTMVHYFPAEGKCESQPSS